MPQPVVAVHPTALQKQLIKLCDDGMSARRMSGAEVAEKTGLSRPYVSQLLNGIKPGTIAAWDVLIRAIYGRWMPALSPPDQDSSTASVIPDPDAVLSGHPDRVQSYEPPRSRPDGRHRIVPSSSGKFK